MQILITKDNFSVDCYELRVGEKALEFHGNNEPFALPYSEIKDFCITKDKQNKAFFSVRCQRRLYEGKITEPTDVKLFAENLKERLSGIINIEVIKQ